MNRIGFAVAVAVLVLKPCVVSAAEVPAEARAAMATIDRKAIHGHMAFLADDLLEGRDTGSAGYEIAARYVASRFLTLGLEPAGDGGTFLQRVPFRESTLESGSISFRKGSETKSFDVKSEVILTADPTQLENSVEAPVVFAGFGVTAPDQKYDDYRGLDVQGKVVLMYNNAPATFPSDQRAHYANRVNKAKNAAARGAVGIIQISLQSEAKRIPWEKIIHHAGHEKTLWLEPDGTPHNAIPQIRATARLGPGATTELFKLAGWPLDRINEEAEKGKPRTKEMPLTVRIETRSRHATISSPNVVGVLRGSDPVLRDEYVVYIAHLDHKGIGAEVKGDRIYNGAFDNASGVAMVLEVAKAFASLPKAPARSVVFLAVTGEERGLLGADYFANHPSIGSIDQIVAALSVDMQLALYPLHDIVAFGAEHSSLGASARDGAGALGIRLSPDFVPEEVLFVRTDHYPFVQRGVPALFLVQGIDMGDGKSAADVTRAWARDIYHSPQDDMNQAMDFEAMELFARVNFLIGHEVVTTPARPTWNEGDFFGELFGD